MHLRTTASLSWPRNAKKPASSAAQYALSHRPRVCTTLYFATHITGSAPLRTPNFSVGYTTPADRHEQCTKGHGAGALGGLTRTARNCTRRLARRPQRSCSEAQRVLSHGARTGRHVSDVSGDFTR